MTEFVLNHIKARKGIKGGKHQNNLEEYDSLKWTEKSLFQRAYKNKYVFFPCIVKSRMDFHNFFSVIG